MAQIKLKGNPIHTSGNLPEKGSEAPDFLLTKNDLSDVTLKNYAGKKIVLNIFPSVDTGVCAASVRRFNQEAAKIDNAAVLCISADLPFAHSRFCAAEGINNVDSLSELRQRKFGEDYGLRIIDGPMAGLMSRAVIVLDEKHRVVYTEQVPEITQEPDYEKALKAI